MYICKCIYIYLQTCKYKYTPHVYLYICNINMYCKTLHHILQHTATHCHTLQHIATLCNTLHNMVALPNLSKRDT